MNQSSPELYHERQRLQLCALHSLNNLFQTPKFTKSKLDEIVHKYDKSWCWNEYSTVFTGNYDLTILIDALDGEGYCLRAIDRDEPLDQFPYEDAFGLLLNSPLRRPFLERIPIVRSLSKPGRHWFTIKNLHGTFYNCDSNYTRPDPLGDRAALIVYLKKLNLEETYIYLVFPKTENENFH